MNREREIALLNPVQQVANVEYLDPAQRRFAIRCILWGKMTIEKIGQKAEFLPEFGKFRTSFHEIGHKVVAKAKVWSVPFISRVRKGNILGVTVASPDPTQPIEKLDQESIAISHGGEAAENLLGYESFGSGSDRSHAKARAHRLSIIHGGLASPASYDSAGASDSHQTLVARGVTSLEDEAFGLYLDGEQAA